MTPLLYKLDFKELGLTVDNLMLVMGYENNNNELPFPDYIAEILDKSDSLFSLEGGLVVYDNIEINKTEHTIKVGDIKFDAGKIVVNQLKNSESLAFFVCTAGKNIELYFRQLFKDGDFPKGYIADMIGSVAVDTAMDIIQNQFKNMMAEKELNITNRYSPGYCGWHVSEQQKLFGLFPANICNITLSEHSLMSPIKSVSGVIGIGKKVKFHEYTCNLCEMKDCFYRNIKQTLKES